jgi:hypothetical protein
MNNGNAYLAIKIKINNNYLVASKTFIRGLGLMKASHI